MTHVQLLISISDPGEVTIQLHGYCNVNNITFIALGLPDYSSRQPKVTIYLLPIARFTRSVTICKILTVKMCMTLALTFKMGQRQM